jgi:hypothetical protein
LSGTSLPVEDVEEAICELPPVSDVRLLVQRKRPDDFIAMAQRGFFVYDWSDVHRTMRGSIHVYELIAMPSNPIKTEAIPEPLKRLAMETILPDLAFVEEQALDIEGKLRCSEPPPS